MEVFIRNIHHHTKKSDIIIAIADVLHGSAFANYNRDRLLNFDVSIHPRKRGPTRTGILIIPILEVATRFLRDYGDQWSPRRILVSERRLVFSKSTHQPTADVISSVKQRDFADPRALQERENIVKELEDEKLTIRTLQFGWECRDDVFSVEWERQYDDCRLHFDPENNRVLVKIVEAFRTQIISIAVSQLYYASTSASSNDAAIFFSLAHPPTFECDLPHSELRQRQNALDDADHHRVSQYACYAIRLVCSSWRSVSKFRDLGKKANLRLQKYDHVVERRERFSRATLATLDRWLEKAAVSYWPVAFQVDALVRNAILDAIEVLDLVDHIDESINEMGPDETALLLQYYRGEARRLWYSEDFQVSGQEASELFLRCKKEFYNLPSKRQDLRLRSNDNFDCFRVTVTPTLFWLDGPFSEKSNRVFRLYRDHEHCFLRVVFADENRLQMMFNQEVDMAAFTNKRFGGVLREGLTIAGKHFSFLAYTMSSLKEHAVWFMTPFVDSTGNEVTVSRVIERLGTFKDLSYDESLMRCPARYGARISQSFTTTDSSVTTDIDEVEVVRDITRNGSCFTDGVGTMSNMMAKDIWKTLASRRGHEYRKSRPPPRALQVRFMGSKGMLSVDYTLSGRRICLRDSMVKFDAPNSKTVEIAGIFDRPMKMLLNRPLIMILEGLGVPASVFMDLQAKAVRDVREATKSIGRFARLLETHGLGSSFRLISPLLSMDAMGMQLDDDFYKRMVQFSVYHILRQLKHKANIPVPGWHVVGVADVHGFLKEGEVFVCYQEPDSAAYCLKGPVLVARSPVIHPGDVQVVQAIGLPPEGSPFEKEQLQNTIVFSTNGVRPLPSCLGGGDLDGDTYIVTPHEPLHPKKLSPAAEYPPSTKKMLFRTCTMADVADFVVEYINSEIVGIVATRWLTIADQRGIFDKDCLKLAKLHSDAVDYQTGMPVAIREVPKNVPGKKPDWSAPETQKPDGEYYESSKAIGQLFRAIDLNDAPKPQQRELPTDEDMPTWLDIKFSSLSLNQKDNADHAVGEKVSKFLSIGEIEESAVSLVFGIFKYFAYDLHEICSTHSLSYRKYSCLTEEEAIVGTIVAKASNKKWRQQQISSLREKTAELMTRVRSDLAGDTELKNKDKLRRAWVAWKVSSTCADKDIFGARTFKYIALGSILDTIKSIEDVEKYRKLTGHNRS
ncbi:RdRP-domain-containing protein [Rickenella mellea]|uniref:RNA-dependent RNA polymerase n=1 Tax=Rickenella mellea TaxID=50990 RepID=A0A4Y7QAG8_9AGAM|nr:RdRP-domain-containing protein [Rickenella mellea]